MSLRRIELQVIFNIGKVGLRMLRNEARNFFMLDTLLAFERKNIVAFSSNGQVGVNHLEVRPVEVNLRFFNFNLLKKFGGRLFRLASFPSLIDPKQTPCQNAYALQDTAD
jgi:hypothetical protein